MKKVRPLPMPSSERRTSQAKNSGRNGRSTHKRGEPTWDVALLYPKQGEWTEEAYLDLTDSTNRMFELVDGYLEALPMPDPFHQRVVRYTFKKLDAYATDHDAGEVLFAPCPVRLWAGRMREPDIFLVDSDSIEDPHQPPSDVRVAFEAVSPGKQNRDRDTREKPKDYAKAKIGEYWIIDPEKRMVTVLRLVGKKYMVHGKFKAGDTATSAVLDGFALDVAEMFAVAEGKKRI